MDAFLTKTAQSPPSTTAHQKDVTETDAPASNEMSLSTDNNINMMEIEQQATYIDDADLESGSSDPATERSDSRNLVEDLTAASKLLEETKATFLRLVDYFCRFQAFCA